MRKIFLILIFTVFISINTTAQNLATPRISPHASVSQTIGFTVINIDYHRPGVKGRKIWDGLVPYGEVWRAGANENTTIEFTGNVKINGNDLKAGKYGFHIIPNKDEWILIFNKVNYAWGSFFYDQNEDALRIKVYPSETENREWLQYGFENLSQNSCDAYLHWEKLKVSFKIEIDFHENVITHFREELKSIPGFSWQGYYQAASYALQNGINLEEAMTWIDKSIEINPNLSNLYVKSELLKLNGENEKAADLIDQGIKLADEQQMNTYGYALLAQNKLDEAIKIFSKNVEKYPESWNVYDSLAEALIKKGELSEAIKNFNIALEKAPENQKQRIERIIKDLSN